MLCRIMRFSVGAAAAIAALYCLDSYNQYGGDNNGKQIRETCLYFIIVLVVVLTTCYIIVAITAGTKLVRHARLTET